MGFQLEYMRIQIHLPLFLRDQNHQFLHCFRHLKTHCQVLNLCARFFLLFYDDTLIKLRLSAIILSKPFLPANDLCLSSIYESIMRDLHSRRTPSQYKSLINSYLLFYHSIEQCVSFLILLEYLLQTQAFIFLFHSFYHN